MVCRHEAHEQDTAVHADGLCPLCLWAEVQEWRSCARYDLTMEGPRFRGWDRSQMERCRRGYLER